MSTTSKVAFITGANRGIGLETARLLGKEGVAVVIGSRDLEKGRKAAAELKKEGVHIEVLAFDSDRPEARDEAYSYFEKTYGKLDILINNAGVLKEQLLNKENSSSISAATLEDTFRTNFFSVIYLTQKLLPLIRKSPAGRIVNVSSVMGSLTIHSMKDSPLDMAKPLAYDASKTALNAFTVHLAHELRDTPIKVNSIHPGWVKTDMGGAEAPTEVKDGANTSLRLALIGADGPTGGFFHEQETLPW